MQHGKNLETRNINFNIYASSDEEAERGRKAIVQFINIMGQQGAMVSGDKLVKAMAKLGESPFMASQIIKFFKQ
jgi:hypothetical protein